MFYPPFRLLDFPVYSLFYSVDELQQVLIIFII